MANLMLHRGSRQVSREELARVRAPEATPTWFPLAHGEVVNRVEETLGQAGFRVARSEYGLARGDQRLFGVMDLASTITPGVTLAVGIRNSTDKSLPIGFAAGSRVLVCDNLAFCSEVVVSRKHTRFGEQRFVEALARACEGLVVFREQEARRIEILQNTDLGDTRAESLILRAWDQEIISHRQVGAVLREWREPERPAFAPRNAWSLFNAFTEVMKPRQRSNAQKFSHDTILLNDLFSREVGLGVARETPLLMGA